jgi:hypothetical protein
VVSYQTNAKHRRTFESVFADPVRPDVGWADVESFFLAVGAEILEGRGSRIRVKLKEYRAVFHRPHPKPDTDRGALKAVRRFLRDAGVEP